MPHTSIYEVHASAGPLAKMLGIFAVLMGFGAFFAWLCIPRVQEDRPYAQNLGLEGQAATTPPSRSERWTYPNIPLEVLAEGRKMMKDEGQKTNSQIGLVSIFRRKKKTGLAEDKKGNGIVEEGG